MLIVLVIIGIVLIGVGLYFLSECCEMTGCFFAVIGAIIFLGSIIGFCTNGSALTKGKYLDSQIAMYIEENTKIEQKVADSVNAYISHESGIMDTLKTNPESSITIVAAYPTLNSSELIAEQIKIYNSNNQKIKELKEQKVLLGIKRWWIYFGS